MIPLEMLEKMFSNIRAETPWAVDGEMLWGYFFFDAGEGNLRRLSERLVADGYRLVELGMTDDGDAYRLHVEKVEVHTPASLFQRNAELEHLAEDFGVDLYDGMDVGPVPGAAVVAQPEVPVLAEKKGFLRRLFG